MGHWKRLDFGNKSQNFLNSVLQTTVAKRGRWTCEEREEMVEIHHGLVAGDPMAAGGNPLPWHRHRRGCSRITRDNYEYEVLGRESEICPRASWEGLWARRSSTETWEKVIITRNENAQTCWVNKDKLEELLFQEPKGKVHKSCLLFDART